MASVNPFRKRWEVVARDRNGRVIGREQFWRRRSAEQLKAWQDQTAWGEHLFLTPVTAKHGPLFTNDVQRIGV